MSTMKEVLLKVANAIGHLQSSNSNLFVTQQAEIDDAKNSIKDFVASEQAAVDKQVNDSIAAALPGQIAQGIASAGYAKVEDMNALRDEFETAKADLAQAKQDIADLEQGLSDDAEAVVPSATPAPVPQTDLNAGADVSAQESGTNADVLAAQAAQATAEAEAQKAADAAKAVADAQATIDAHPGDPTDAQPQLDAAVGDHQDATAAAAKAAADAQAAADKVQANADDANHPATQDQADTAQAAADAAAQASGSIPPASGGAGVDLNQGTAAPTTIPPKPSPDGGPIPVDPNDPSAGTMDPNAPPIDAGSGALTDDPHEDMSHGGQGVTIGEGTGAIKV